MVLQFPNRHSIPPLSLSSKKRLALSDSRFPFTVCHELSHLKGIIQEDEANFLAYVAATGSDNTEFRYAGYLEALEYVDSALWENGLYDSAAGHEISVEVQNDWYRFLPENYWEENAEKEIIPTEAVSEATDTFLDTNIKMNGREEGIRTYNLVVQLLLDYYYP